MSSLNDLVAQREVILKATLFMFLHDVGKLQPGHQAKFIRGYKPPRFATRFSHYKNISDHPSLGLITSWEVSLRHQQTPVSLGYIITKHHGAKESKDGLWAVLAQRIDRLDSKWDRDDIASEGVQPVENFISITSSFGWTSWAYKRVRSVNDIACQSKQIPWSLYYAGPTKFQQQTQDCLDKMFRCLINIVQSSNNQPKLNVFCKPTRKILYLLTIKACGDTRFSVNDITLWDHCISTAILFKVLASWVALAEPDLTDNRKLPRSSDNKFTSWFCPQLLPLRIDGLAYLAASNNVPDLLARRELLTRIYDTLQDILEWEFPLTGEVYRDENGPVFLTYLRNANGKGTIPLSGLQLPKDGNDEHVLADAYTRALQTERKSLEDYLRQVVVKLSQGDLTLPPQIPFFTYTQKSTRAEGEKSLGDLLADEQKQGLWLQADVSKIQEAWEGVRQEVCSICSLRPLGFGAKDSNDRQKAISRRMCGVCLERRVDRAKTWAQGIQKAPQERFQGNHPETVWLDEVADANGRLALLVGYFPLEHWLDGTLVESLAMFKRSSAASRATNRKVQVTDENGKTHEVVLGPKPVSYSRLRRIWETTRRFWQDVAPTDAPPKELQGFCNSNGLELKDLWEGPLSLEESVAGKAIGEKRARLFLKGHLSNGDLGPFHAYEMVVQGRKVAVLWVPLKGDDVKEIPEEYRGGFWVIENLGYLEKIFSKPFEQILQEGASYEIYEPSEYGRPGRATARFTLAEKQTGAPGYTPLIPILAEPRTFMTLVPADKAIDVVRAIKAKYEREMGKVRNRLPLHLGIVFADAHQPLRTILDAGQRMLKQQTSDLLWRVVGNREQQIARRAGIIIEYVTQTNLPGDTLENERPELVYDEPDKNQFQRWHRIVLLSEERFRRSLITWYVPAVMGDGQTEDHWYPYAFWKRDKNRKTDPGGATQPRTRYYQAPNPFDLDQDGNSQSGWLVHAGELQEGDVVYFTPATLDFIWLDHGGTRFEIAYDQSGRRRGTLRRPYLLDEVEDLVACWKLLAGDREKGIKRLGTSQLHAVRDLIETKRAEWFEEPARSLQDNTFKTFCENVLRNAEWVTKPTDDELMCLTHWAVTGLLADAVELFYHVLKQRPVGEEET